MEKNLLTKKINIIYLTRNGLLEPLGQSQVIPYLRGLSKYYSITLISYEKFQDFSNSELMNNVAKDCIKYGIRWLPQKFKPNLNIFFSAISILKMIWLVKKVVNQENCKLIHARSYIPAFVALIINRLKGTPFIFDMRALWPEELITAQRMKRDSILHRIIKILEKLILKKSSAVISLTNAAVNHIKSMDSVNIKNKLIMVIPTCVDLKKFKPNVQKNHNSKIHGCLGTILSGWFRIDLLSSWIRFASLRDPKLLFEIITRDDAKRIRMIIDPENELNETLKIKSVLSKDVPAAIHLHDVSLMFFSPGLGKLGSAPTRLAEALSSGIPVVVNKGVGDMDEVIKKNNVGVVVDGDDKRQIEKAFEKLQILLQDPELSNRCYNTAISIFSLDKGIEKYHMVYKAILNRKNI